MKPEAVKPLCAVSSKISQTAEIYQAAKYHMDSIQADGFARMARKESRERWCLAGEINDRVSMAGITVLPVPAIQQVNWKKDIISVLENLHQHDLSAMQVIDTNIKQLFDLGCQRDGDFLCKIGEGYEKEVYEVRSILNHVKASPHDVAMNEAMKEKYEEY